MLDKLKGIRARYEALGEQLSAPETVKDMNAFKALSKERASLEEIVAAFNEYEAADTALTDCRAMLEEKLDPEMKEMVHGEIGELEERIVSLEEQLRVLLLPKDPNDERDVILEIRAGTGGDEAALFGADLLRMYQRYAERSGYKA